MNRRFVNLVLEDNSRMHSLFRLDVAKHLFYPSTAQAEAANAKQETNNGGGGAADKPSKPPGLKWPKTPRIKWMGRLPEPSMRFFPFDAGDDEWRSYDDAFMLLRPNSSEGTILHATDGGRTVIYDADKNAISATVPFFDTSMGREPIVFSVPGAGAGEKESLYVMHSTINSPVPYNRRHYSSSHYNNEDDDDDDDDRCSGDFVVLDFNQHPLKWQHLPRPPFVVNKDPYERERPSFSIRSSAVIDGGRTIVVPSDEQKGAYGKVVEFTYCFDTSTRQWRHAGDWALPFAGRAEYVPELETWIGLSSNSAHHLCATDLSSAMDAGGQAPTPEHVWDDFTPPPYEVSKVVLNRRYPGYVLRRSTDWWPSKHSLVSLGSGRFCILKTFGITRSEWVSGGLQEDDWPCGEEFAVLTGVEVVRCNDDGEEGGGLRMVKHKSKRCLLDHDHWLF
ncbi:hypothetical protein HU200_016130 [Digitaria exilis]|uniref:Uncharacterized protein n=1 Tax=Digitaria exilis TaxID=1010633 RepID=A0A835KHW9_9POAL|nr:hypothetical protein HU200_016130 [Digitaria exilis]